MEAERTPSHWPCWHDEAHLDIHLSTLALFTKCPDSGGPGPAEREGLENSNSDWNSSSKEIRSSSPSQDAQDARRPQSRNPSTWTVEDVVWFVKDADPKALGPHVELFRKHEIDGNALLLLRSDMVMKYLGLKLGPALKLCHHIDKLKQAKF
ncbi:hypothetical protein P7K49_008418 [Saguinus oedipus]|uniref:SAM domain-containing protein n=1 Tax=Saguinus oedipus TaxID=9490 RepID=A0ABQ9VXP4_SAGOE|nr:hypothetical protein P7K49_008418 [Saguinus oedipus]